MHKILIYTQHNCRQSDKLKQLLNNKSIQYIEKDISHDVLLKREMIERTGGRSVTPQTFVDGKHMKDPEELQRTLGVPMKLRAA